MSATDITERVITAYHEAAHAITAAAVGQQVTDVSIRPVPASQYYPGSLGRMCTWPHPDPQPSDCWIGSLWVETSVMTSLAGYLVEDLLCLNTLPTAARRQPGADHGHVVSLLRTVASHDLASAVRSVRALRAKAFRLLSQPMHVERLHQIADLLLERETISGADFYLVAFSRNCGAVHPTDSSIRCSKGPHPFGEHLVFDLQRRELVDRFPGLPMPNRKERVSELPGNIKRLRALNRGGPGPRLSKRWTEVLDASDELNVPMDECELSPLTRTLARVFEQMHVPLTDAAVPATPPFLATAARPRHTTPRSDHSLTLPLRLS